MAEVVTRVKLSAKEVLDAVMDKAKAALGAKPTISSTLEEIKLDEEGKPQEATVVFRS